MRLKQELTNKKDENAKRAIESHAGFVSYVVGKVKKHGFQNVLGARKLTKDERESGEVDDLYWLRVAYERVLTFAEEYQIKQVPTKLEGTGENGEFKLIIEIADENKVTPETGNRISQYIEV